MATVLRKLGVLSEWRREPGHEEEYRIPSWIDGYPGFVPDWKMRGYGILVKEGFLSIPGWCFNGELKEWLELEGTPYCQQVFGQYCITRQDQEPRDTVDSILSRLGWDLCTMSPFTVFYRAWKFFKENPGAWLYRDHEVPMGDERCLSMALSIASRDSMGVIPFYDYKRIREQVFGKNTIEWNDAPGRTVHEVIHALSQCIDICQEQGQRITHDATIERDEWR